MRNLIGFGTPSKEKAQEELNAQTDNESSEVQMNQQVGSERLAKETLERLSQLGDVICSDNFQSYPTQQRQQILLEFAYYSKVADSVL
jgi:hypothetical protein